MTTTEISLQNQAANSDYNPAQGYGTDTTKLHDVIKCWDDQVQAELSNTALEACDKLRQFASGNSTAFAVSFVPQERDEEAKFINGLRHAGGIFTKIEADKPVFIRIPMEHSNYAGLLVARKSVHIPPYGTARQYGAAMLTQDERRNTMSGAKKLFAWAYANPAITQQ